MRTFQEFAWDSKFLSESFSQFKTIFNQIIFHLKFPQLHKARMIIVHCSSWISCRSFSLCLRSTTTTCWFACVQLRNKKKVLKSILVWILSDSKNCRPQYILYLQHALIQLNHTITNTNLFLSFFSGYLKQLQTE